MIVLIMGVAGSGKSTVGELLSERIGWPFFDPDGFHPPENVEKQRQGIPLTDADREPWIKNIHAKMLEFDRAGLDAIFGCSALKEKHRKILQSEIKDFLIVHLKGDRELIRGRVASRKGHFMPASLVDSQFESLEMPNDSLAIDVTLTPDEIVKIIRKEIRK